MADLEWDIQCSAESHKCINPIRQLVDRNVYVPNPAKNVIKLNIGDPTFFGNHPASPVALKALSDAALSCEHNAYLPTPGLPAAREAVAEKYSYPDNPLTMEDVQITSGCAQAIEFVLTTLCSPGDNFLMPRPGFSIYKVNADSRGVDMKYYDLLPDRSWEADIEQLESLIDEKTRVLVVVNPSNPCGSAYSKEHLLQLIKVAEKHRLPILTDEIYEHIVYNGGVFHPLASLSNSVPILTCGGIAKRHLIPGWRTGWLIIYDQHKRLTEFRICVKQISARILGASSPPQAAIPRILKDTPQEFFDRTNNHLATVSSFLYDELVKIPCLRPIKPVGAMYMLVGVDVSLLDGIEDDADFTAKLMSEESVFCLPGFIFTYPNFFRIVLLAPLDTMKEAADRMAQFCQRHMTKTN